MSGPPEPTPALSLARRVARDSLVLAPSYLVPGLASLLTIPLLFRPLGAEGYGTWALIYAIANGVPVVTSSWLEAISVRFGHRPGSRVGAGHYVASVLASCLAAAVLAGLLIPGADAAVVAAAVAFTGAVAAYLLAQARLQARMAFGAMSRSAAIRAVAGAILAVGAAFVTGSPSAAALGAALGFAIGTIVALPDALQPVGQQRAGAAVASAVVASGPMATASSLSTHDAPFQATAAGGELRFGAASAVAALAAYVLSIGDRFVLSAVGPLAAVGTYAATYAVIDLVIRLAPSIVFGVVRPRLFRAWDRGERGPAAAAVGTLAVILAWGTAALTASLVLAVTLIPATRLEPPLVGPIAAGLSAFVVGNAVALLYSSGERQVRLATHVVIGAGVNIGLNLALDPSLGPTGAALATAASYLLVLALNAQGLPGVFGPRALRDGGLAVLVLTVAGLSAVVGPVVGLIAAAAGGIIVLLRAWAGWRGLRAPAAG